MTDIVKNVKKNTAGNDFFKNWRERERDSKNV